MVTEWTIMSRAARTLLGGTPRRVSFPAPKRLIRTARKIRFTPMLPRDP